MIWKLSNFVLSLFLILVIGNCLESKAAKNNIKKNLLTRFCLATLKSKLDKKEFKKIANFTCACFYRKFSSGSSIRESKLFCKRKTLEEFNL